MRFTGRLFLTFSVFFMAAAAVFAEIAGDLSPKAVNLREYPSFPSLGDQPAAASVQQSAAPEDMQLQPAIWPFGKKDETVKAKPKSTRKAFFLSLLVPGLGETYVGSKRGLIFLGIEAVSWWMYTTNTNKGNDLDADFRLFADTYWHYADVDSKGEPNVDSKGDPIEYSYWEWLLHKKYVRDDTIGPYDYDKIRQQIEEYAEISVHHYSGNKDQQDYEMVGKYPQFIYGWEDIVENNPTLRNENGKFNGNYNENISIIASPLREHYEDMRYDSNKKLKAGQRGIHIMIVNRILSAVDAGRLAYKHNKKLESELSSVQIRMVQKRILDTRVTMLTITKKF